MNGIEIGACSIVIVIGNLLYHGLVKKEWFDGLMIGIIAGLIYIPLMFLINPFLSKYEGLCRPCYNKGIVTEIRFSSIPEKWECKDCIKENLTNP